MVARPGLCMHEKPTLTTSFKPDQPCALKWVASAPTRWRSCSPHQDACRPGASPSSCIGAGPLSVLDPTQAPPGKHTTYAWHVMPLELDMDERRYEDFKAEFAEKIIETWARYSQRKVRDPVGSHVCTGSMPAS